MLFTRWIEDNRYFREKVVSVDVLSAEGNCLLLKANAVLGAYSKATSADTEMFTRMKNAGIGDCVEYRIRIEFLEKNSLHVSFSKGTEILNYETLMVDRNLAPAKECKFCIDENQVTVDAGDLHTVVTLKPYFLQIFNNKTRKTVEIGGNEKNYFNTRDSLNTGVCYMADDSLPVATENFALSSHEAIYGFGEKFLKLNKVGQTIELYAEDGIGIGTPRTYKNIPFYVSTNGYGVYFNHSAPMTFWVGSKYAGDIQVAVEDDFLDYYIFTGDIKTVLDSYTSLTGKSPMPPKWSYGYWQSKITYVSAEETLDIVEHMRKEEIPCDVIHIDTYWFKEEWFCDWVFDNERFHDAAGYIKKLAQQGVKLSLWLLPYLWGSSEQCCKDGLPITRALVIDYQDDPNVWNIEDQYMSGESIMVAPIYTPDNRRMVYFPEGNWTDWHTGEKIKGGIWKGISADIETLPLYVKEGAIIPLGPVMNYVGEKAMKEIELRIYPFEKDGVSRFSVATEDQTFEVEYTSKDGSHTLWIGETAVKVNVVVCGNANVNRIC